MKGLSSRLEALEARGSPFTGSHWIICEDGETRDQALARYEAENGPVLDTDMTIIWVPV